MVIFLFFDDFWAIKFSPFFQMGEISASIQHQARSDIGWNVPETKMTESFQIWPFWCMLWPFPLFFKILSVKIQILSNSRLSPKPKSWLCFTPVTTTTRRRTLTKIYHNTHPCQTFERVLGIVEKNFWTQNFVWTQNSFLTKNLFWPKIFFWPSIFLRPRSYFGHNIFLDTTFSVDTKFFLDTHFFLSQNFFDPKIGKNILKNRGNSHNMHQNGHIWKFLVIFVAGPIQPISERAWYWTDALISPIWKNGEDLIAQKSSKNAKKIVILSVMLAILCLFTGFSPDDHLNICFNDQQDFTGSILMLYILRYSYFKAKYPEKEGKWR